MSASVDGTAKLWDLDSTACLMTLTHKGGINAAKFSLAGDALFTGGGDGVLRVWNMHKVEPHLVAKTVDVYADSLEVRGHKGPITCIDVNVDDMTLATGSADNTIKLWKFEFGFEGPPDSLTFQNLCTIGGHRQTVYDVAFSSDGLRLVSCGDGTNLHVWWGAGPTHMTNLVGHTQPSKCVAWTKDMWVVSGCMDGKMRRWDNTELDELGEATQILQTCLATYNDDSSKMIINSFVYAPLPLAQKINFVATQ